VGLSASLLAVVVNDGDASTACRFVPGASGLV